jgi:hypothetical protein
VRIGEKTKPRVVPSGFIEHLQLFLPCPFLLAVIDLARVPHNPLHFIAAGQSPVFDPAELAEAFTVLLSCDRPQEYCRAAG